MSWDVTEPPYIVSDIICILTVPPKPKSVKVTSTESDSLVLLIERIPSTVIISHYYITYQKLKVASCSGNSVGPIQRNGVGFTNIIYVYKRHSGLSLMMPCICHMTNKPYDVMVTHMMQSERVPKPWLHTDEWDY